MAYFKSPGQAVDSIRAMLRAESWDKLSRYYDLSGTDIDRAMLISGDFFIRKKRPEVAHPAGFWKYKHPFSPAFEYARISSGPEKNVYIIHLEIEIDQGSDSPAQVGLDSFYMIQSDKGWQVLPGQVEEAAVSSEVDALLQEAEPMPDPPWKK